MRTHLPLSSAAVLGAVVALAIAAAPAQATTAALTPDGQFLEVGESFPGETNNVVAKLVRVDGSQYVDLFDDQPVQAGAGCATSDATGITRCVDPVQGVRAALGGGDDRFTTSEIGTSITFGAGGLFVDLGAGNDIYEGRGTNAIAEVHGGDGADDLRGSLNSDRFDGGPGSDTLHGYEGPDHLQGGADDDTLTGDGPSASGIFADVLDGGPGRDRLDDYVFSGDPVNAPAISVSLDGVANDGRQGEQDAVSAVEAVKSGSAGSFTGDDAANEFVAPQTGPPGTLRGNGGDDTLIAGDANGDAVDGGAGSDMVEGGFGDDRLTGGPGRDTVSGDRTSRCNEYSCDLIVAGNDMIEVRDGEIDSVTCGPGVDRVIADGDDVVAADCENVERSGAPPPADRPRARVTLKVFRTSLGTALRRGLKVRVNGAAGTVRLKAKRGRAVVARGSGRARGVRGRATVTLRFTAKAKRALRRKRRVSLRISGAGASSRTTLRRAPSRVSAAAAAPGPPAITMRAAGKRLFFDGPATVRKGQALRIVNDTSLAKYGPHTFSLAKPSMLPGTPKERRRCFAPRKVCMDIAQAHKFDMKTGKVAKPVVDAGAKGWDRAFSAGRVGDSWYTEAKGGTFTRRVTARAGTTLSFICALHPDMQGSLEVVSAK